jgi:hypothetical protein
MVQVLLIECLATMTRSYGLLAVKLGHSVPDYPRRGNGMLCRRNTLGTRAREKMRASAQSPLQGFV